MKTLLHILITIILTLAAFTATAQVRVTGHVSAEVVESVAAHNAFNQNISLTGNENSIELGSLIVEGPRNSAYDISVNNATIYNQSGSYSLETGLGENWNGSANKQSLTLSALLAEDLPNGDYDGKLTVIVSYN